MVRTEYVCCSCKVLKPIEQFPLNKTSYNNGRSYRCYECNREAVKKSYKKHREKTLIRTRERYYRTPREKINKSYRKWILSSKFGISIDEYNNLLEIQNGVCAICKNFNKEKNLAVDHDHETGKIRGLLCSRCNLGIGQFNDNIQLLSDAISYLENYK